jgi:hypothetical protein
VNEGVYPNSSAIFLELSFFLILPFTPPNQSPPHPPDGAGEGAGLGEGKGETLGDTLGEGLILGDMLGLGLIDGLILGEGYMLGLIDGLTLGDRDFDGFKLTLADGFADILKLGLRSCARLKLGDGLGEGRAEGLTTSPVCKLLKSLSISIPVDIDLLGITRANAGEGAPVEGGITNCPPIIFIPNASNPSVP